MRIILGYDGSEFADVAIDDLSRAGISDESDVLVFSVAQSSPMLAAAQESVVVSAGMGAVVMPQDIADQASRSIEQAADFSRRAAMRVRELHPTWRVTYESAAGVPSKLIIARADAWEADLIVIGSHGRTALQRLVLGSVSQAIVNQANCSVRVARKHPHAESEAITLLIGVDASANAALAVAAVAQRTWPAGTKVHLLAGVDGRNTIIPNLPIAGPDVPIIPLEARDEWARHALSGAAEELNDIGLDVHKEIRVGDPSSLLMELADQSQADCIFVGANGHGRLERLLLGSVSASVTAKAKCSVEVVRSSVV
jgi:nucleotide-binding universal stress UspA family protein